MRLEKLYYRLKGLVNDNTVITIRDNIHHGGGHSTAEIVLSLVSNDYHWTVFRADTVEQALRKAIDKLKNPEKNFIDENGKVWKAKESSVYSTSHIEAFLRKREVGAG